jgi:hypothetical protein
MNPILVFLNPRFLTLSLDLDPLLVLCDDLRCDHTCRSVDNTAARRGTPSTLPLRIHQCHRDTFYHLSQASVTRARYTQRLMSSFGRMSSMCLKKCL